MNSKKARRRQKRPSTLESIANFLDRRRRPSISLIECGSSGFGDRMRGIAYALFLAKKHGASKIYYSQAGDGTGGPAHTQFPFQMTDLISIRGMESLPFSIPIELRTATYVHFSEVGNALMRYGFSEMWRVEAKQPEVIKRLAGISEGGPYLSLHVRKTDAEYRSHQNDLYEDEAVERLQQASKDTGVKRVYVAADNAISLAAWRDRLAKRGFDLIANQASFDPTALRQTGAEDTMVDFFALARSQHIVRTVPSEFSRYAAWIGKKWMGYRDLG